MEDQQIVQLYFDREERAIPETAKKYGRYFMTIARNILGNGEDAEECVNDTYLQAWNTIPPNRPQMLSAFLGKIVRNLAFNKYKYNTADKRGKGELPLVLQELAGCIPSAEDVAKTYEKKELTQMINEFLAALPEEKRRLFVRRYWYTDSVNDIARHYGMSPAAVSMSLKRLREKLHHFLKERRYEL